MEWKSISYFSFHDKNDVKEKTNAGEKLVTQKGNFLPLVENCNFNREMH